MNEKQLQHTGLSLLRVSLGIVLIAHSLYLKLIVYGLPGTVGFFESLGLPGFVAYLTVVIEIVAGTALIVGYKVRMAALAAIPVLLGATWAHSSNGWVFSNEGGGWEYPLLLAIIALSQVLIGHEKTARTDVNASQFQPAQQ